MASFAVSLPHRGRGRERGASDPHIRINLPRSFMLFFFSVSVSYFPSPCVRLLPPSPFHLPLPLQLLSLRQCLHFITFRANKTCHLPSCPLPQVCLLSLSLSLSFLHTFLLAVVLPAPELSTRIKLTKLLRTRVAPRTPRAGATLVFCSTKLNRK